MADIKEIVVHFYGKMQEKGTDLNRAFDDLTKRAIKEGRYYEAEVIEDIYNALKNDISTEQFKAEYVVNEHADVQFLVALFNSILKDNESISSPKTPHVRKLPKQLENEFEQLKNVELERPWGRFKPYLDWFEQNNLIHFDKSNNPLIKHMDLSLVLPISIELWRGGDYETYRTNQRQKIFNRFSVFFKHNSDKSEKINGQVYSPLNQVLAFLEYMKIGNLVDVHHLHILNENKRRTVSLPEQEMSWIKSILSKSPEGVRPPEEKNIYFHKKDIAKLIDLFAYTNPEVVKDSSATLDTLFSQFVAVCSIQYPFDMNIKTGKDIKLAEKFKNEEFFDLETLLVIIDEMFKVDVLKFP